ncbi:MAG: gamma-glutamyl-gamma-aminobutyrate hydrolase family protein [Gammaproteobacteria bacterium]|nr:gamma-glutamyl-gamma-aminobutyrate hydrolase family protein [Gammaproteobacteria bacterium]
MRLHWLQHVPFEGLGSIEPWAEQAGATLRCGRMYANDALPAGNEFDGLIVVGGPMGVHDHADYPWLRGEIEFIARTIAAGKPVLGICLGAQLIAAAQGAKVYRNPEREIGWLPLLPGADYARSPVAFLADDAARLVFHWHGDTFDLPRGALHLAATEGCRNQIYLLEGRVLGLQCHLETTRASAQALIEHCGSDLQPGRYGQSAASIVAADARFAAIERPLHALLELLFVR